MQTLFFTGNADLSISLAAAAYANAMAQSGRQTLLVSLGPVHRLPGLFGLASTSAPQMVAPHLHVWAFDSITALGQIWEQARTRLGDTVVSTLSSDELPLLPGLDILLGLDHLNRQVAGYDTVVIDAGGDSALLRALAVPDGFRWGLRLLFGLDRDPGRSSASISRAMIPTALLPFDWFGQVQEARVQVERLRDDVIALRRSGVCYVLRPDSTALHEACLSIPTLQLYGLAVQAIAVGPLLPTNLADPRLATQADHQHTVLAQVATTWASRPLLRLPWHAPSSRLDDLTQFSQEIFAGRRPDDLLAAITPIEYGNGPPPFVAIDLPGLPREALHLTISGDEFIVRAGPYRRHMLLPVGLRGNPHIKASREGDRLVVRLRG